MYEQSIYWLSQTGENIRYAATHLVIRKDLKAKVHAFMSWRRVVSGDAVSASEPMVSTSDPGCEMLRGEDG
jgi:hypothetical protein